MAPQTVSYPTSFLTSSLVPKEDVQVSVPPRRWRKAHDDSDTKFNLGLSTLVPGAPESAPIVRGINKEAQPPPPSSLNSLSMEPLTGASPTFDSPHGRRYYSEVARHV